MMDEQRDERPIQRILIGLDASHHSLAALRAAAELATSLQAELVGLFVEDVNLLRVAELQVGWELQFPFAVGARLNPDRMERQLRAQAQLAEEALGAICKRRHIEWSFRVVQGQVSQQLLEEATRADLLCLGRASRPVMHRSTVGSTTEAAAMRAPHSVLVVPRDVQIRPPVVVLYEGRPDKRQALLVAAQLAQHKGGFLSVLVPPSAPGTSKEIQESVTEQLDVEELLIRYRELVGPGVVSLVHAIQSEGAGLLVMEKDFLPPESLKELLDALSCPTLLMS